MIYGTRVKGLISAIIIALFIPACLVGCGKIKKEETPPTTTTSASEEIKIPEAPSEPIVDVGNAQPQGQSTTIINNYVPAQQGAPAGWSIPLGGIIGSLAAGAGTGPFGSNPPPVASSGGGTGGIVVYSVGFIPDNAAGYVNTVDVGQMGKISALFANKFGEAKDLNIKLYVNNDLVVDEVRSVAAYTNGVYATPPTAPPVARSYALRLSIDPVGDEDPSDNSASSTLTALPPPAGSIDLSGSRINFVDDTGALINQTTVGQPGKITMVIFNSGPATAINVPVQAMDGERFAGGSVVASVQPNQDTNAPSVPYTFITPGLHTLRLRVNPSNDPPETNANNNETCSFQVNVLPAGGQPGVVDGIQLRWKRTPQLLVGSFSDTEPRNFTAPIGEKFCIRDTIVNNGREPSGDFKMKFIAAPGARPGTEFTSTTRVSIPSSGSMYEFTPWLYYERPGTYDVAMTIDPDNSLRGGPDTQTCRVTVRPLNAEELRRPNLATDELKLFMPTGSEEIHETVTGQQIKISANLKNTTANNVANAKIAFLYDDEQPIVDTILSVAPNSTTRVLASHVFRDPGPHRILMRIDPEGTTIPNELYTWDNVSFNNITIAAAQTQGPAPAPLRLAASAKPDVIATDIGFIPNGERDYMDEVTAGRKGSIYAVYDNTTADDIRNLKVQIRVDGQVVREAVKPYLRKGERATISVSDYWFNKGRHKMNLLVDPDNTLKESKENNNNVGHYITAVARQQPRNYDTPVNYTGFFDPFKHIDTPSGGTTTPPSTYTPPRVYTSGGVDQGSSSTSTTTTTTTKKTAYTVKPLGK